MDERESCPEDAVAEPVEPAGADLETGETLAAPGRPARDAGEEGHGEEGHPSDSWRPGQILGDRYTLLELLGRGGMSEVYLGRHELLKKTVAIKVLRPDIAVTKPALSRFHREAVAAASIGSPHIVETTDYGFTEDGNAFIVMERLVGMDLRTALVGQGALPAGRAVGIIRQVLRGLSAAHAQGIVHRDLKAENVFLCRRDEGSGSGEFVKVLDFGISKVTQPLDEGPEASLVRTSTGAVMGTPQYIAPEQAHGDRDVDHRVDIYSAGVMLYEMLTGELPFSGKSALDVVMKHVQEDPEPPRQRRPDLDIPPDLDRIVLKAMAKAREDRYADAEAMSAALPEPTGLPGGFSSTTLAPVAPGRSGAGLWTYGVLLLALVGAGALGLFWVFPGDDDGRPSRQVRAVDAVGSSPVAVVDRGEPARGARDAGAGRSAVASAGSGGDAAAVAEVPLAGPDAGGWVTVRLQVLPPGARILERGQLVGRGELARRVARGATPLELQVQAPGYESLRLSLPTDRSQLRRVTLRRRRGGQPSAPAGPAPGGRTTPADLHGNPYLKRPASVAGDGGR